jgi:hypothetical protein
MEFLDLTEVQLEVEVEVADQTPQPGPSQPSAAPSSTSRPHMLAPALSANHHLSAVIQRDSTMQASMMACLNAAKAVSFILLLPLIQHYAKIFYKPE